MDERTVKSRQMKADMMLLAATLLWGTSYIMTDLCLREMGPLTLNAYRFIIAFVIAAAVSAPKLRRIRRSTVAVSALLGFILMFVYIFTTCGLMYTTQSNAAFLCSMSVLFTPLLSYIFKGIAPGRKLVAVVAVCIAGIGLMSLDEELHVALGDILCMMCSASYAVHLMVTEAAVCRDDVDAYQVGVLQLLFTGVFTLAAAFIFEEPALPQSGGSWLAATFLAVFCTGIIFVVQPVALQYTSASHASVIFTLEPVSALAIAFFFAGERLLLRAYIGALLLMAGLLMMETDVKRMAEKLLKLRRR